LLTAGVYNKTTHKTYDIPTYDLHLNYVTPIAPILPTITTSVLPTPPMTTDPSEFYRHLNPIKTIPKFLKPHHRHPPHNFHEIGRFPHAPHKDTQGENMSVFTLADANSAMKFAQADSVLPVRISNSKAPILKSTDSNLLEPLKIPLYPEMPLHSHKYANFVPSDSNMHDMIQQLKVNPTNVAKPFTSPHVIDKKIHETMRKVPISNMDQFNYFLPIVDRKPSIPIPPADFRSTYNQIPAQPYFQPILPNTTGESALPRNKTIKSLNHVDEQRHHPHHSSRGKHVTILRNKDLKTLKPTDNSHLWTEETKTHLLTKAPNPYETVLLRPVPNAMTDIITNYDPNAKTPRIAEKTYSALDLERLLSQMEVESEVNRNLGRSADKSRDSGLTGQPLC
jgi:hypothetical protein